MPDFIHTRGLTRNTGIYVDGSTAVTVRPTPGMLGSNSPAERSKAAKEADKLIKTKDLTWEQVVAGALHG